MIVSKIVTLSFHPMINILIITACICVPFLLVEVPSHFLCSLIYVFNDIMSTKNQTTTQNIDRIDSRVTTLRHDSVWNHVNVQIRKQN